MELRLLLYFTLNNLIGNDFSVKKMNMWRVGGKHDIKQWIFFLKSVPMLEVSGLLTYSKFSYAMTSQEFAIDPQSIADASV